MREVSVLLRQINYRKGCNLSLQAALSGKKIPMPVGYTDRNPVEFDKTEDDKAERAMRDAIARKMREKRG